MRDSDLVLAVDVGGTDIKAEIVDTDLVTRAADVRRTPVDGDVLAGIVDVGKSLLAALGEDERARVAAVGLAMPGVVDLAAGRVVRSVNLGWRDVPIVEPVSSAFDLPVVMSHDVQAAGFAEWRRGAGHGVDDLLVVTIGTGIAAAVVAAGRLVTGGLGQAGEIGHIVVGPGDELCSCGQYGCLETVASARAIATAYHRATGCRVTGAADVRQRLGTDAAADAVWACAVSALADALVVACALLAPARIVIGGGLADADEHLLGPLRTAMERRASNVAVPDLVRAALGSRAGVVGAALRAFGPDREGAAL